MNNSDEMNRSSFFETSDLPLTVTLVTLGFNPIRLDAIDPSRVVFLFPQEEKLQAAIDKFWAGKLVVEPKAFWNTQRELKARIRNQVTVLDEQHMNHETNR